MWADCAAEIHLASIHGLDSVIRKLPVSRIRNKAGRFRLNVRVVEPKVIQRGVGISADVEGLRRPSRFDIPDVYIAEMRQALLFGNSRGQRNPVRRNMLQSRRQG